MHSSAQSRFALQIGRFVVSRTDFPQPHVAWVPERADL
jgi:hypothetical protein